MLDVGPTLVTLWLEPLFLHLASSLALAKRAHLRRWPLAKMRADGKEKQLAI